MRADVKRALVGISIGLGVSAAVFAQGYTISTVAGAVKNANGDGVIVGAAVLFNPQQVAVDSSGNAYIADGDAHRVRKMDSSGNLTVIAGQGRNVGSGDAAILAVNSPMNDPTGVALDPTGKILYIAERDNHKVKKLDLTTGMLTTVAGYAGRAGYAGDSLKTLCSDGKTVCGALYARLNNPQQLAVDSVGNIYVADRSNNRIRKICIAAPVKSTDCTQGTISTVAGIGPVGADPLYTVQSAGDGGLAIKAQLARPEGVAVDTAGDVFIADTLNNKIRRVDATTGIISTVMGVCIAGAPLSTNSGGDPLDTGVFILPVGTVWPACGATTEATAAVPGTPSKTAPSTFVDGNLAINATLNRPRSLTFDASGNLYIADTSTNRIREIYAVSGSITSTSVTNSIAGNCPTNFSSSLCPSGLLFRDGPGNAGNSATPGAILSQPRGVAVDSSGNVIFTDQTQGQISTSSAGGRLRVVNPATASVVTLTTNMYIGDGGTGATSIFNDPRGVSVDATGNVYVSDANNNHVRKLAPNGALANFAGSSTIPGFSGDTAPALFARLNNPTCAATDSAGNVYVADRANNRIRKVDTLGNITTIAGGGALNTATDGIPAVNAVLNGPRCVAVDPAGNLYIADTGNNAVRKVDTSGNITTIAGTWVLTPLGTGATGTYIGLCAPAAVTVGPSGPQTYQNCNSPGTDGGPGTNAYLNAPQGIALNTAGTQLYIADTSYHAIRKVDLASGIITLFAGATGSSGSAALPAGVTAPTGSIGPAALTNLNTPISVATDPAGNVYIADTANYRVVKVDAAGMAYVIAGAAPTTCSSTQTPAANLCSPASFAWGDNTDATATVLTMPKGVAADASGNVYVTEGLGIVRKLSLPSTATTPTPSK